MVRLAAVLMIATLSVSAAGCAGLQREHFIHEQIGDYVYDVPVDQVWPHVLALLKDEGFSYKQDTSRHLLTTEWKEEMSSSSIAASFTRYLIEANRLDSSHTRVRIMRNSMSMGGGPGVVEGRRYESDARNYANAGNGRSAGAASGARDLRMEWLLLKRVAPQDAAELQELADARFQ